MSWNLATLKSLGAAAVAVLAAFNVPSAPTDVRAALVLAGGWIVGLFVHRTSTPSVITLPKISQQ